MDRSEPLPLPMPVQPIPAHQKRVNIFSLMAEDVRTAKERDPAARSAFMIITTYAGVHALWAHRVSHWLWKHKLYWLARAHAQVSRFFTGVEIHPGATIGRRFFIDHGMGVVIGETAEIADDVTLYHGVTLGGVSLEKVKRHPTLEQGVVVGAGAKVLGNITIGSHSRIGANAVVVKSVPSQSVVVGVPGQIIKRQHESLGRTTDLAHTDLPDAILNCLQNVTERLAALENQLNFSSVSSGPFHLEPDGVWQFDEEQDYVI
ncbi:MAG: serine O-acetyltransferase EpsC [Anaerolineaceae bacterium]